MRRATIDRRLWRLLCLPIIAAVFPSMTVASADLPLTLTARDGADMVLVPAGRFILGTDDGAPEEGPPHPRDLPSFYIDRTEVTAARYAAFLAATGHPSPPGWVNGRPPAGTEQWPVTTVRWTDALQYALWAGKRLPTEAEWEMAARSADRRRFPWGDADDAARRNKDTGALRPVGAFPEGASLCGALDLSGNAWEWTADWFEPYPGTTARSPHYGPHYKVIRGGGGEGLYATANTGTTTQRARLVPYGAHDFVGFRCAQDPPGQPAPYDAVKRLREAEALLAQPIPPPRKLTHERAFAAMNAAGRIPLHVSGVPGQTGLVTMGFPLPRARVRHEAQLEVQDATGRSRSLATAPMARWPDGSLRWVLLRFPAQSDETVHVHLGAGNRTIPAPSHAVTLTAGDAALRLGNGLLELELDRTNLLRSVRRDGRVICHGLDLAMTLENRRAASVLRAGPADTVAIESHSDLHATLRWRGRWIDDRGAPSPMTYDLRLGAEAGSPQLRFTLTVVHAVARQQPWEERIPTLTVTDWRLGFRLAQAADHWLIGTENGALSLTRTPAVELRQPDEQTYSVLAGEREAARGTRAPGWLAAVQGADFVCLGVRDFWQNHPKRLRGGADRIEVGLWHGSASMSWEGGLAKTHDLVLEVAAGMPSAPAMVPLLGISPADWVCGTEAAGALLPRNAEALRQLGYWETWRETAMRRWVNAMPTGWRDYGDAYMGGPYKGKNAFLNLEYDVPFNFLLQYLRTGERWYFDAARVMTRHQEDIDTEQVAGFAWKHSPLHTTTPAEFGHAFLRGLLLSHLLTGDPRNREIAEQLGGSIARELSRFQGLGNERQIGWSLCALSALHEVTGSPSCLETTRAVCERLAREQTPAGRFKIRWDNRIAFFNGIAANGLLCVLESVPDPAIRQAVLRLADRTLGMYPEYAARTLNAWSWVIEETRDPRFLHNLERTWVSTLEFLLDRDATTAETHAWRFPRFVARHNLLSPFPQEPGELPQAEGWQAIRFKNREVHLALKPRTDTPAPLVIVREGLARGTAVLVNPAGEPLRRADLHDSTRLIECVAMVVPAHTPWLRLRLESPDAWGWQVQHDRRVAVTVVDPQSTQLPFLLPRAIGALEDGAHEVTFDLEATGEGHHSATLFDPNGVPVGHVHRFIDFEDPGTYRLELKAPVTGPRQGWSLELNAVRVLRAGGFGPCWSASIENWFDPETPIPAGQR